MSNIFEEMTKKISGISDGVRREQNMHVDNQKAFFKVIQQNPNLKKDYDAQSNQMDNITKYLVAVVEEYCKAHQSDYRRRNTELAIEGWSTGKYDILNLSSGSNHFVTFVSALNYKWNYFSKLGAPFSAHVASVNSFISKLSAQGCFAGSPALFSSRSLPAVAFMYCTYFRLPNSDFVEIVNDLKTTRDDALKQLSKNSNKKSKLKVKEEENKLKSDIEEWKVILKSGRSKNIDLQKEKNEITLEEDILTATEKILNEAQLKKESFREDFLKKKQNNLNLERQNLEKKKKRLENSKPLDEAELKEIEERIATEENKLNKKKNEVDSTSQVYYSTSFVQRDIVSEIFDCFLKDFGNDESKLRQRGREALEELKKYITEHPTYFKDQLHYSLIREMLLRINENPYLNERIFKDIFEQDEDKDLWKLFAEKDVSNREGNKEKKYKSSSSLELYQCLWSAVGGSSLGNEECELEKLFGIKKSNTIEAYNKNTVILLRYVIIVSTVSVYMNKNSREYDSNALLDAINNEMDDLGLVRLNAIRRSGNKMDWWLYYYITNDEFRARANSNQIESDADHCM